MVLKYDTNVKDEAVVANIKKLTNQVFALLPSREEGVDWEKPLATILEELSGMDRLFENHHAAIFFPLLCKLEGLFTLTEERDFLLFRGTIFECLGLLSRLAKECLD